jgi:hypothetical protein
MRPCVVLRWQARQGLLQTSDISIGSQGESGAGCGYPPRCRKSRDAQVGCCGKPALHPLSTRCSGAGAGEATRRQGRRLGNAGGGEGARRQGAAAAAR